MYRLLVGDIALQRGDAALAARAYFEAARDTRDAAARARARPKIALAARQRALALEAARLWAELDPAAERPRQVIAAGGLERRTRPGHGTDLQGASSSARSPRPPPEARLGDAFLQLNRLLAHEPDKAATFRLVRVAGGAVSRRRRGALRRRARRVQHRARRCRHGRRSRCRRSTARSRSSPAGSGRCCSRRRSSPSSRRRRPSATSSDFLKTTPESKAARGARAGPVEQKRYADARAMFEELSATGPGQPRVPVRHGDALGADEGLDEGRSRCSRS